MSAVMHQSQCVIWQAGFLSALPTIRTHAKIQFRRLPLEQREDAVQEAIANACVSYQKLAVQGKLDQVFPSSLATYAVKQVRAGRHVGGSQDAAKDAMSPVAQARHHFRTCSYDLYDREANEWRQLVIEDKKTPVPDLAAFRIDFVDWLKTLTNRDRKIIRSFIRGERTSAIADRFNISPARVSQLRRKYEDEWRAYQKQATEEAA